MSHCLNEPWCISIRLPETYFNEILIGIQTFSFEKTPLKMSSAKCCSYCRKPKVLFSHGLPSRVPNIIFLPRNMDLLLETMWIFRLINQCSPVISHSFWYCIKPFLNFCGVSRLQKTESSTWTLLFHDNVRWKCGVIVLFAILIICNISYTYSHRFDFFCGLPSHNIIKFVSQYMLILCEFAYILHSNPGDIIEIQAKAHHLADNSFKMSGLICY